MVKDNQQTLVPSFSSEDGQVVEVKQAFNGFTQLCVYRLKHRLFRGGWSDLLQREVLVKSNAVVVLPYDPKLDQVVLIEQFRVGVMVENKQSPWIFEVVAGYVNEGESSEQVVHRETHEESGLKVKAMEHIASYWVSPGASTEKVIAYCAQVDAAKASGVHGLDEEHEDIRVFALPFAEAYAGVVSGAINNGAAILTLQWLHINRDRIRKNWLKKSEIPKNTK